MTGFASKDLAIAPREDGWDEPSNEPNPVLIAFRATLEEFPHLGAWAWATAFDAHAAFGGYKTWEHPRNVYHALTVARPDQIEHARRVIGRLAAREVIAP